MHFFINILNFSLYKSSHRHLDSLDFEKRKEHEVKNVNNNHRLSLRTFTFIGQNRTVSCVLLFMSGTFLELQSSHMYWNSLKIIWKIFNIHIVGVGGGCGFFYSFVLTLEDGTYAFDYAYTSCFLEPNCSLHRYSPQLRYRLFTKQRWLSHEGLIYLLVSGVIANNTTSKFYKPTPSILLICSDYFCCCSWSARLKLTDLLQQL